MPLPPLQGDIVLNDRSSKVFDQIVAKGTATSEALTSVQAAAKQTGESLANIGKLDAGQTVRSVEQINAELNSLKSSTQTVEKLKTILAGLGETNINPRGVDALSTRLRQLEQDIARAKSSLATLARPGFVTPTALGAGGQLSSVQAEASQRVEIARQAQAQIMALEAQITQTVQQESARRLTIEQTASQQQVQNIQQQAEAEQRAVKQVGDSIQQAIAFGKQGPQGVQIIDLDALERANQAAKAAAAQRTDDARAEAAVRKRLSSDTAAQVEGAEKQITTNTRSEVAQRERAFQEESRARQQAQTFGQGLTQVAGVLGVGLGVREIAQQTVEMAQLGTEVQRSSKAFEVLSGSTQEAQARLNAITKASAGAVDALTATRVGTQILSLHLADTAEGFGKITTAARAVSLVSPVIHDVSSAITELGLASANLSFRRLDQLGLSVSEVKDRIKELQTADASLDDSQAFLTASVDLLNEKYGKLLDTTEAQASGLEIMTTAWRNFRQEISVPIQLGTNDFFRQIGIALGGGQLQDLDAELKKQVEDHRKTIAGLGGGAIANAIAGGDDISRINAMRVAIQNATLAQKLGVQGANEYAKGVETAARGAAFFGEVLSGTQIQLLKDLNTELKVATGGLLDFNAALGQQAQTKAIDELKKKLDDLKNRGVIDQLFGPDVDAQIKELEDILAKAEQAASQGIPITVDPRVKEVVSQKIADQLPDTKAFDELQAAEQRLADTTKELNRIQADSTGTQAQVQAQTKALQLSHDLAQFDVQIGKAKQELTAAEYAYAQALAGTNEEQQKAAKAQTDEAATNVIIAQARKDLFTATEQIANAQDKLAATRQSGTQDAQIEAQANLQAAEAKRQHAQATLELLAGEKPVADAAQQSAHAYAEFRTSMVAVNAELFRMAGGMGAVPPAFNAAILPADQLSDAMARLSKQILQVGASASQAAFNVSTGLIPKLGIAGAAAVGRQFQQGANTIVQDYNRINAARIAANQPPIDPALLQHGLTLYNQWAQGVVAQQTTVADSAQKEAEASAKAWEDNQQRISKATASAIDSIAAGVLKPTATTDLIAGNKAFQGDQGKKLLEQLLPREDAVDEQARRLADVAANGFKSPWFESLKNLFPPEVLDKGELEIQKIAANMVREHEKGLSTFLYDIPKAADQVLEKIQAKKNTDALVAQVRERVQGLAQISNLDIQDALGIDTSFERQAAAIKDAFGGLPQDLNTLVQQIHQLFTGDNTQISPIANALTVTPQQGVEINAAAVFAASAALTAASDPTALPPNPVVTQLTVTPDQQTTLATGAQTAMTSIGEAMVTQASDGNYGGRAVDAIIASIEAKAEDTAKAGRNFAEVMGKAFIEKWKDGTPKALLDIFLHDLAPLIAGSNANTSERTAGAGVQ